MLMLIRVAVAFVLLGLTAFCFFGFLATYEPPGFPVWRLGYGVAGLMGLTGIGWVLARLISAGLADPRMRIEVTARIGSGTHAEPRNAADSR